MCCTRLAGNAGLKNSPSGHHCTNFSGYIFITKACIDNRKNLLSSNISPTCPHNVVNFGLLVWGSPANFHGFRILAVLLHSIVVGGGCKPNFVALNRGRHLYSAGRPSRWALAHILVLIFFFVFLKPTSTKSQAGILVMRCNMVTAA